ncbi:MAG: hypothetical protein J6M25_05295, partial [Prevotella sp.]|nr:hypothetical protein [Prevotella sp.]
NPLFASECHLNLSFPYLFESTRTKDYLPGGTKTWARLKIKIPCPSFEFELLTDLVTQLLSATEVQGRYKCPHFDALSSLS